MTTPATSRERWVQATRESVLRALQTEGIPCTAQGLEGNLDITRWSDIGFLDQRTAREIAAALRWLEQQGFARQVARERYDMPGGKLYVLTDDGRKQARA